MVQDLLDIDEDKISYESEANSGEKVKKDVLLNENDELWKEVREDKEEDRYGTMMMEHRAKADSRPPLTLPPPSPPPLPTLQAPIHAHCRRHHHPLHSNPRLCWFQLRSRPCLQRWRRHVSLRDGRRPQAAP
jgi:hypothetical protein